MIDKRILQYGSADELPGQRELAAGSLRMIYEGGFLRYISCGETEILRMINFAVRDQNWGTVAMKIQNEIVSTTDHTFNIRYEAEFRTPDIHFTCRCEITGREDSSVVFHFQGTPLTTFKKNRIGFTVLHPPDLCAGQSCVITHSDGSATHNVFPSLVSPHQPFMDIQAMKWDAAAGTSAVLEFEGDIFETEDQRNWLDASYKTYCTPLSRPFPVTVEKGETISQRISLRLDRSDDCPKPKTDATVIDVKPDLTFDLPNIGLTLNPAFHSRLVVERLKALGVGYLNVELKQNCISAMETLKSAIRTSDDIGCKLQLSLFVEDTGWEEMVDAIAIAGKRVEAVVLLSLAQKVTSKRLLDEVAPRLRSVFPGARIGAGTDAFFAELNRERVSDEHIDFITFPFNPQVHASDVVSISETPGAIPRVIDTIRSFANGKAIHVGPVTLRMRWNPNATAPDPDAASKAIDARQVSLFNAAWIVKVIKYLAESNVSSATLFETIGHNGLAADDRDLWPFGYPENSPYPLYFVLHQLLWHKTGKVIKLESSRPLVADGIALKVGSDTVVLLANLTGRDEKVSFSSALHCREMVVYDYVSVSRLLEHKTNPPLKMYGPAADIVIPAFSVVVLR